MNANKFIIGIAIVLFIGVNTSSIWEMLPGLWDMAIFLLLAILYVIVVLGLIISILKYLIPRYRHSFSLTTTFFLLSIVGICTAFPGGFYKTKLFQPKKLLYASAEGGLNCHTSISLYNGREFTERSSCFGVDKSFGGYSISSDTIWLNFETQSNYGIQNSFATLEIKPMGQYHGILRYFTDPTDSNFIDLLITHIDTSKI